MGLGNKSYNITDATGATAFLAASNRREVLLRNAGPNTCYLAFNETAVDGLGIYLKIDDSLVLDELKCDADLHAVCAVGETAVLKAQITL